VRAVMVAYPVLARKRRADDPGKGPCQIRSGCLFLESPAVRGPYNRAGRPWSIGEKMYKKKTLANRKHKRRKARLKAKMKALKSKGASK